MFLIQRLLVLLITLYRRFLSGRLTNVRCSFSMDETCSAFGLRIARTARSGRDAIARIARRLRRCGDACLLADGTKLGWSELHDRSPREIADAMRADGEGDRAIWRMLQTRLTVARWCGDRESFEACRTALQTLSHHAPFERPRVISFAAAGARALERYRFVRSHQSGCTFRTNCASHERVAHASSPACQPPSNAVSA